MAWVMADNRVHKELEAVDRMEHEQMQYHGPSIQNSRPFLMNRRQAYKEIIDDFKDKTPNKAERASLRILMGQRRAMLRQLYPNPLIRLLRNVILLVFNILRLPIRFIGSVGQMITTLPVERSFNRSGSKSGRMPVFSEVPDEPRKDKKESQDKQDIVQEKDKDLNKNGIGQNDSNAKPQIKTSEQQVSSIVPVKPGQSPTEQRPVPLNTNQQPATANNHQQNVPGTTTQKGGVLSRVYVQRPNIVVEKTGKGQGMHH